MNEFNFSASSTISSVEGMCSGFEARACRINLASCSNSNRISYGVLLDNVISYNNLSMIHLLSYLSNINNYLNKRPAIYFLYTTSISHTSSTATDKITLSISHASLFPLCNIIVF